VTVLAVCAWANLVGAVIPIAAQRFRIDPTVVSAPLITTLVDASGLFIYLTIAHFMIAALAFHVVENRLELPSPIVFAAGPDDLLADSEPLLEHVKSYLKSNPQVTTMRIEGHVDQEGLSDEQALALSVKRAAAAKAWLVEHEAAPARLLAAGFGRAKPVAKEQTKEAREKNTRVEFVVAAVDGKPTSGAVDGGGKVAEEKAEK
jgi:outer membrane protein OmpA-like peptidoglycan-associated protein